MTQKSWAHFENDERRVGHIKEGQIIRCPKALNGDWNLHREVKKEHDRAGQPKIAFSLSIYSSREYIS